MSWGTRNISLIVCGGISIFGSVSFLLKFTYFFNKKHDSLNLERHNSLQNLNNRKATHSFTSSSLIFKLQQEVWKFHDICVSWGVLKTEPETNLLKVH